MFSLRACPNNENVRAFIETYYSQTNIGKSIKMLTQEIFEYVDNVDEINEGLRETGDNGFGIQIVNSDQDDWYLSPELKIYYQMDYLFGNLDEDFFHSLHTAIIFLGKDKNPDKFNEADTIDYHTSVFAHADRKTLGDLSTSYALFSCFPIIRARMPDFQTILEDKDSYVAALAFQMGCPESTYWLSCFIVSFLLSVFPYLGLSVMLCFGFGLTGTSFSLFFVISVLFLTSHIWFQFMLTTFMKKVVLDELLLL
jgi:hypothetical protein